MRPLAGVLVVDASRMLPGAVLGRQLIELGARLIKVEQPLFGDPLRSTPPIVDGCGAGFREFYAGAESIRLDLRRSDDAARLIRLASRADVLVESFRPASSEAWGIAPRRLAALNPRLVVCTLSAFGGTGDNARRVGHDLNFVAGAGALDLMGRTELPRLQLADVSSGLLACSAILAALLARVASGCGTVLDQPLAAGPLPFLTWALADRAAGGGGLNEPAGLMSGAAPAYRLYSAADGLRVAVCALEPKFWVGLLELLGLPGFADAALDTGRRGLEAAARIAERLAREPRATWLERCRARGLPVTAVNDLDDARHDAAFVAAGLLGMEGCGPYWPAFGPRAPRVAPSLGQHDGSLRAEFGLDPSQSAGPA